MGAHFRSSDHVVWPLVLLRQARVVNIRQLSLLKIKVWWSQAWVSLVA